MVTKLAIIGSRTFNDWDFLWNKMTEHFPNLDGATIISGGACGADALAKRFAEASGLSYEEFPADWDRYGKSAGVRRNTQIIEASDIVCAFWDGESRGTWDSVKKAIDRKKTIFCFIF